jgi:hypothetical protein
MIGQRIDPRLAARDALRTLVQDAEHWPAASPTVLRNLLMDACGGDIKPWAMLLLAAQGHGYVERIAGVTGRGEDVWNGLRTQLVVGWVSEGFLQREAAQWAVESWAYALGVISLAQLTIPAPPSTTRAVPSASPSSGKPTPPRSAPAARVRTPPSMAAAARRPAGRPVPAPPPIQRPLLAPLGSAAARWPMRLALGVAVSIPLLSALVVASGRAGPGRAGLDAPPAPASITASAAAGLTPDTVPSVDDAMLRAQSGPTNAAAPTPPAPVLPPSLPTAALEPVDPRTTAPPDPRVTALATDRSSTPLGVTSLTRNALPLSAADSARTLYVRPATRAPGMSNGLPRGTIPMTGLIAAVPTLDELHLRSGRVLRGRVEIIRASLVVFRDADDGLRYEFPKQEVESIHTEIGTVVRFDRGGSPLSAKRGSLVARGVSGNYLVSYRLRSVQGSANCRGLWQRPLTADRVSVIHLPGADTLTVGFVGGDDFPSVVDPDGYFASTFRILPDQARQSTALTTRLNGRFTDAGFDGEINIIAYRRARTGDDTACHSILDMRAVRAEATTGARLPASARPNPPRRP